MYAARFALQVTVKQVYVFEDDMSTCVKRLSDKTTGRIQREECFSSENRMHSLCTFLKLIMLPIAL